MPLPPRLSIALAVSEMAPLTVLEAVGETNVTVGGVVSAPEHEGVTATALALGELCPALSIARIE